MATDYALEAPGSLMRAVSPFREMGAYEALWSEARASFKWIADKFREHPGAVPSDFVPDETAAEFARKTVDTLAGAGVGHFGIRVHGAGEYPMKLRVADHPVELLYFQGWWDLAESRGVAVVGTGTPSAESALERGDWFAVLSTINSRLFRALRRHRHHCSPHGD